eukprot:TRINITY_DN32781_c0_g1_i1.p2 TRINITY_DN32781_c0_g1~~TRINITY_DN32781_c0_g1_i1.p2  ORF type:complete len:127 (-),score=19.53 TRINITY_DN32781_c0_g1_i1:22-402(-)
MQNFSNLIIKSISFASRKSLKPALLLHRVNRVSWFSDASNASQTTNSSGSLQPESLLTGQLKTQNTVQSTTTDGIEGEKSTDVVDRKESTAPATFKLNSVDNTDGTIVYVQGMPEEWNEDLSLIHI